VTQKTRDWKTWDWKTRGLKNIDSITKHKCSYNFERESTARTQQHRYQKLRWDQDSFKTATLKSSVYQGMLAPPSCAWRVMWLDEITLCRYVSVITLYKAGFIAVIIFQIGVFSLSFDEQCLCVVRSLCSNTNVFFLHWFITTECILLLLVCFQQCSIAIFIYRTTAGRGKFTDTR